MIRKGVSVFLSDPHAVSVMLRDSKGRLSGSTVILSDSKGMLSESHGVSVILSESKMNRKCFESKWQ